MCTTKVRHAAKSFTTTRSFFYLSNYKNTLLQSDFGQNWNHFCIIFEDFCYFLKLLIPLAVRNRITKKNWLDLCGNLKRLIKWNLKSQETIDIKERKKKFSKLMQVFFETHVLILLMRWVVCLSHEYFNFIMYDAKYYQHFIGGVHFSWEYIMLIT